MPRPERGVGQGTFRMPLAGGSTSVLGSTLRFFWGSGMARRRRKPDFELTARQKAVTLDPDIWSEVAITLDLTPQQSKVVNLILRGYCDKQIAVELKLSYSTVRTHLGRLFQRIGAQDRSELILAIFAIAQTAWLRR